ncbi:MAG: DEAD/DEAH box helicase [Deltaproteobacteria bacterium]|nr:DEAD/DEAH box helicase [Deltaproteobacteria bacterium]
MTSESDVFSSLSDDIRKGIEELGWTQPMPVQEKAIPLMQAGGDLIVKALTGSGKTGAFAIPICEAVDPSSKSTQALIMLPTRELAIQVAQETAAVGKYRGVRCLPIYGGVGYGPQIEGLQEGAHIIVGTPGRILDHIGNGRMDFSELQVLVLDEADEMLSLGFWPDMREIASHLPESRRTHLFSATIPEKVRSLSRFFQNDAEFMTLEGDQIAPQEIEHFYYVCTASNKEATLLRIIEYEDPESAIVFCNTKADVRYITSYLTKRKIDADQISGDLNQAAREKAIGKIKQGNLRFLIATDVAARGIDISDLSHVISYSTSDSPEVYVHRTGRTGRAGKSGVAISLVSGLDIGNFKHMQNVIGIKVTERKIPSEKDIRNRIAERLKVKVEQEMRALPADVVADQIERLIPVVETLADSHEGRRDLAGILAAYLAEHRPETTVTETASDAAQANSSSGKGRGGSRSGGGGGGRGRSGGGGGRGRGSGGGRGRRSR